MKTSDIPASYTVASIEGQWYALEVSVIHDAENPDGYVSMLYPLGPALRTRNEAIAECCAIAEINEMSIQAYWEGLVVESNVYPERCAYYVEIIEQITGHSPIVSRGGRFCEYGIEDGVSVSVLGQYCSVCGHGFWGFSAFARTLEDALAQAAELVYAGRCLCECEQDTRLQLVA